MSVSLKMSKTLHEAERRLCPIEDTNHTEIEEIDPASPPLLLMLGESYGTGSISRMSHPQMLIEH